MSKPSRVRIKKKWWQVPNPWHLVGHPIEIAIEKTIIVDNRASMGSTDYSKGKMELSKDHPSLEAFCSLALHEASEHLNDAFEWNLDHPIIQQWSEAMGPFVCQWFYAQLEALAD